jgi:hypothetical protein
MLLEPVLVGLDRKRPHQPQAALGVGKDPHNTGTAFDLLVEALQYVSGLEMLMVLARQPVKEPAPAKAGVSVSSMFSSTQPVSLGYLPDHLVSQAAGSRRVRRVDGC